jgi:hypothetical protein
MDYMINFCFKFWTGASSYDRLCVAPPSKDQFVEEFLGVISLETIGVLLSTEETNVSILMSFESESPVDHVTSFNHLLLINILQSVVCIVMRCMEWNPFYFYLDWSASVCVIFFLITLCTCCTFTNICSIA